MEQVVGVLKIGTGRCCSLITVADDSTCFSVQLFCRPKEKIIKKKKTEGKKLSFIKLACPEAVVWPELEKGRKGNMSVTGCLCFFGVGAEIIKWSLVCRT